MTGEHEFFISPRVNGWIIVTGVAIPAPDEDVDECFRFLVFLKPEARACTVFPCGKVCPLSRLGTPGQKVAFTPGIRLGRGSRLESRPQDDA